MFNTDDAAFGGGGRGDKAPVKTEKVGCHDQPQSFLADLPPMSAVVYRCVRKSPERKPKAEKPDDAKAEKKPAPKKAAAKADKKPAPKKAAKAEKPAVEKTAAEKPKRTRAKKVEK